MDVFAISQPRRIRRRRRRQDKPPASARLVLDDHVKSEHGILSEDLYKDLFPHLPPGDDDDDDDDDPTTPPPQAAIQHVAIAPWVPSSTSQEATWTVVPVSKSTALAPDTVQFSPSSSALQRFATTLQQVAPSKLTHHSRSGIEILVLDAVAVPLDTVFVSLEGSLVGRLENGEGTFFREHPSHKQKTLCAGSTPQARLVGALRVALGALPIVHNGDLFPLPLPPHPVTHVPPNPGKIILCEPVAQGTLTAMTKIIVTRGNTGGSRRSRVADSRKRLNDVAAEDAGETTDQFYSAAEERYEKGTVTENETEGMAETESDIEDGLGDESDEISDDSMDEMISLQAPALPPTVTSGVSTMQPGSPLNLGRGRRANGIATPGSVFSSYTITTARPDRPRGKVFNAHGLMRPISSDLLHPKPSCEDDEEARVYVDVISLTRIGCFSGDWVRLECSNHPPLDGLYALGPSTFGQALNEEEPSWRPVKVFGLPEGYSQKPMTRIPSSKHDLGGKTSFFENQTQKPAGPAAYVSPLLMSNLDNPPYFRLSPLRRISPLGKQVKLTSASKPPLARRVNIEKLRTPVSLSRESETAVFAGLKRYFSSAARIVRTGDLVAVPIDTKLGKAMQEGVERDGRVLDDLVALSAPSTRISARNPVYDEAAWYRIGHISLPKTEVGDAEEVWGDVAMVDSSATEMAQSGSEQSRIPGTKESSWQYYIGLKHPPQQPPSGLEIPGPTATKHNAAEPQHVSPLRRQLRQLFATAASKRAVALNLPPTAILLVSNQRGVGKARVTIDAAADIGLHAFTIDAYDVLNDNGAGGGDTNTNATLLARVERAMACGASCTTLLVRHLEALTADRMVGTMKEVLSQVRVMVATTAEVDKVPDGVRGLFTHELEVSAPDERERQEILRTVLADKGACLDPEVDLRNVALKTAALVAGDLVDAVERAMIARQARLEMLCPPPPPPTTPSDKNNTAAEGETMALTLRDICVAGGTSVQGLTNADFVHAVEHARKNFSDAIGAPKIPNVTWDDVGGLSNVKNSIDETIRLPLERPELFARGMKKRSGILFYGPPGTGKTLLAKAIATEYSLNFFSVKGPELLNMYIGESEANVRRVFQKARDARPCVVFFDELDSVAPKRGNQGDSGGVMDRIVSQLLAELDGMSGGGGEGGGVFVVGATNRPDLLDPALLRPGRFDKMLYLGMADTRGKQTAIMEALTRKFTLHSSVSLPAIASRLPYTYTGADFYALCSDAMLKAVTRQASLVDAQIRQLNLQREQHQPQELPPITTANFFDHLATKEDVSVTVTEADFLAAHGELVPSVSAGELKYYEQVRKQFEGGADKQKQEQGAAATAENSSPGSLGHGHAGEKEYFGKGAGTAAAMPGSPFTSDGLARHVGSPLLTVSNGVGGGPGAGAGPGAGGKRVPSWRKRKEGKGKGKAVLEEEEDGGSGDLYDGYHNGVFGIGGSSGSDERKANGKSKGKMLVRSAEGFGADTGSGDEGLY